ncbi:hypothetical protein L208DRAFT_1318980 [Tricholoma matsutake]|nr:hypothetical protein L208DRAFT_1318980 [Tricholoma matsutake 945]
MYRFSLQVSKFKLAGKCKDPLNEITLGDNLTDKQQEMTRSVIEEFADRFVLAMSKVNTVLGVSHQLKIPEGMTFQTQWSMMPPQWKYLNKKVRAWALAKVM